MDRVKIAQKATKPAVDQPAPTVDQVRDAYFEFVRNMIQDLRFKEPDSEADLEIIQADIAHRIDSIRKKFEKKIEDIPEPERDDSEFAELYGDIARTAEEATENIRGLTFIYDEDEANYGDVDEDDGKGEDRDRYEHFIEEGLSQISEVVESLYDISEHP
jgi:hypothetical protein